MYNPLTNLSANFLVFAEFHKPPERDHCSHSERAWFTPTDDVIH